MYNSTSTTSIEQSIETAIETKMVFYWVYEDGRTGGKTVNESISKDFAERFILNALANKNVKFFRVRNSVTGNAFFWTPTNGWRKRSEAVATVATTSVATAPRSIDIENSAPGDTLF